MIHLLQSKPSAFILVYHHWLFFIHTATSRTLLSATTSANTAATAGTTAGTTATAATAAASTACPDPSWGVVKIFLAMTTNLNMKISRYMAYLHSQVAISVRGIVAASSGFKRVMLLIIKR